MESASDENRIDRRQAISALAATALALTAGSDAASAAPLPAPSATEIFPLSRVRLLEGPFHAAQEVDRAYLLCLESDRLLAFTRQIVGLTPKAAHYGGWDVGGAGMVGHYLSACSHMYAATGDLELKRRIDYLVGELADCQRAAGDGGLFGFEYDRNVYFATMRKGDLKPNRVNGWYLTHKFMAGLRDAHTEGGSARAFDVLKRHADWCLDVTAKLTDAQWQTMLGGEHGAPHEIIADVYALTGEPKYLTWAEKWRHHLVFEPLARNEDAVLDGLHANETIPKFVGYERVYELNGDLAWHETAKNFWDNVVDHRSWACGGDGQWEHFFAPTETSAKLHEVCGPETCATYNMLKLTTKLFQVNPTARYIDYYERALYNGILPSQSPESGFVYYTSLRPGNYRVFSRPFDAFWCCVGTGMENHGKYGELIYAHAGANRLFVNLFIPSTLMWQENGVTVRQETTFPSKPQTRLTIESATPKSFTLSIRQPGWAGSGLPEIRVNGTAVPTRTRQGASYLDITRTWKSGDRIDVTFPICLTVETTPHAPDYAAFFYGPVLLAGTLGQSGLTKADFYGGGDNTDINNQLARKALPDDDVPFLVGTPDEALAQLTKAPGDSLVFKLEGVAKPTDVTLIPLYDLHLQRYAVYWPLKSAETYAREAAIASRIIDRVRVGEPDSEAAHHLASDRSNVGGASGKFTHWRDATGFFSYTLNVSPDHPTILQCAFWGSDSGRIFNIIVDGVTVATPHLQGEKPNEYLFLDVPVPAALTRGKSLVTVRFQPKPGSTAGGVFDLRTMRGE